MEIKTLFEKYLNDELTPAELAQLEVLSADEARLEELGDLIEEILKEGRFSERGEFDKQEMIRAILQEMPAYSGSQKEGRYPLPERSWVMEGTAEPVRPLKKRMQRYAAAAMILLAAGAGTWYGRTHQPGEATGIVAATGGKADTIVNRGNVAVLTLANGLKIGLDSSETGCVAQQAGVNVLKLDAGKLAYNAAGRGSNARTEGVAGMGREKDGQPGIPVYNTITTPRGGQYEVVLQDGSKVWLNAASSLRFPVSFDGPDRRVEITGEAYFEIAKDIKRPFTVSANHIQVEALGTGFDLNAYTDEEAVRTTLIEGSVRVSAASFQAVLRPGEQASVNEHGTAADEKAAAAAVKRVNTEQVIAWKNGYFEFDDAPVEVIMRQLARWYGLDVRYEGKVTKRFLATIPRTADIAQVFRVLAYTNAVHFKIEGNRIIVKP